MNEVVCPASYGPQYRWEHVIYQTENHFHGPEKTHNPQEKRKVFYVGKLSARH